MKFLVIVLMLFAFSFSKEVPFTLEDRDRLVRMDVWIITGVFTAITVATIGFAVWDRRTAIKPLDDKVKKLERENQVFLDALKRLADKDKELFELLKKYNLM